MSATPQQPTALQLADALGISAIDEQAADLAVRVCRAHPLADQFEWACARANELYVAGADTTIIDGEVDRLAALLS
jgi:hypothetical protein